MTAFPRSKSVIETRGWLIQSELYVIYVFGNLFKPASVFIGRYPNRLAALKICAVRAVEEVER